MRPWSRRRLNGAWGRRRLPQRNVDQALHHFGRTRDVDMKAAQQDCADD
jgi:hypothetical protein